MSKAYKRAKEYGGYKKELNFLIQKRGHLMGMVGYIDSRIKHLHEYLNPLDTPTIILTTPNHDGDE